MPTLLLVAAVVWIVFYGYQVRKIRWNTRLITQVAMFVAVYFVLGQITIYRLPQGGSLSLVSMLPLMLCGVIYGPGVGMTAGAIAGLINLITGFYVIHPAQLMLDYFMPYMAYGLSGMLGYNNKIRLATGALLSSCLAVFCNILSGVVFFASYAGEANVWIYSIGYNMSTNGFESALAIIILCLLPIGNLRKQLKK